MTTLPLPLRGHVRNRAWERISYGLYAPARVRSLVEDLAAWQLVLPPTATFSHLTAAEAYGWWQPAPIPHPVFAALTTTSHGTSRAGLFLCRHPKSVGIRLVNGLRLTTPAETLLAAARDLGVLDLVLMADSALRLGHVTRTELKITAGQRRRGAPLLRTVIPLLDERSESPWESIMRVLHVAAEIPVEPQVEIIDDRGVFLARVDLLIEGTRRVHEYDGDIHRDADVQDNDLIRDRRLLGDSWQRHGFTSRHLRRDAATIIADVDQLLGRPWDPRRLAAWNQLLDTSLYGRAGRARAYRQWRRTQP